MLQTLSPSDLWKSLGELTPWRGRRKPRIVHMALVDRGSQTHPSWKLTANIAFRKNQFPLALHFWTLSTSTARCFDVSSVKNWKRSEVKIQDSPEIRLKTSDTIISSEALGLRNLPITPMSPFKLPFSARFQERLNLGLIM